MLPPFSNVYAPRPYLGKLRSPSTFPAQTSSATLISPLSTILFTIITGAREAAWATISPRSGFNYSAVAWLHLPRLLSDSPTTPPKRTISSLFLPMTPPDLILYIICSPMLEPDVSDITNVRGFTSVSIHTLVRAFHSMTVCVDATLVRPGGGVRKGFLCFFCSSGGVRGLAGS